MAGGPQIDNVELTIEDNTARESEKQIPIPDTNTLSLPKPKPSAIPPASSGSSSATSQDSSPALRWIKKRSEDPSDPVKRLVMTRKIPTSTPTLLSLCMTKDNSSWGSNNGPPRTFATYLSMLRSTNIDLSTVSLGLLTSTEDEFKLYEQLIEQDTEGFASATIILHPGYMFRPDPNLTPGSDDWRASRHDNNIQHHRRAEMARLRNYLMLTAMTAAPQASQILWIDADVAELSENLVQDMVRHMDANETVGVLTAISHFGGGGDYDLNAYRGGRSKPNTEQREKMRTDVGSWVAGMEGGKHIHHFHEKIAIQKAKADGSFTEDMVKGNEEEKKWMLAEEYIPEIEGLIRLDAVGATVLMLKTGLVRQGLVFSTSYLVGTDWKGEGWDAIESEGICVTAKSLGAKCFAVEEGWSRHVVG